MGKYIDSEKLIAEIKRQQRNLIFLANIEQVSLKRDCALQNGVYSYILSIIYSLQQGHLPDAGKMVESEHIADVSKMMEQQEVDFEKFISDFIDKKDAENNGRWCEEDIIEAMTQSYKFGRKGGLEV